MSTLPPDGAKPAVAPSGTEHDALPSGTRFGEFEIIRVLGVGGFGIVYLAKDHSLERDVALKEYMPASLAARGQGPQITVRSSAFAETYAIGLRSFVNEARLLARFDHPSLVKVYRFWEDNATAYMVMPYVRGTTLRDTRRAMPHPPNEAWIRSVIAPILSALELLHRDGVYHRDIAPDNILLPHDGPPVLLDFGAARRVIGGRTQALTAILKPSYAPIEQYAEMVQMRQGPWTDLYALGAVIHYLLFGAPPPRATARAVHDDAESIESRIVPGVSPRFLEAVSWMLALPPNQRPQSGEQLRAVLEGRAPISARGRPGITIPDALIPAASADEPTRRVGEDSRVRTAHVPTHLPTTATATLPPAATDTGRSATAHAQGRPVPFARRPQALQTTGDILPAQKSGSSVMTWLALAAGGLVVVVVVLAAGGWQLARTQGPSAAAAAASALPPRLAAVADARPAPASATASTSVAAPATVAPTVVAPTPTAALSPAAPSVVRPAGRPLPQNGPGSGATATYVPSSRAQPSSAYGGAATTPGTETVAATARQACGKRAFISRAICMDEKCEEPRFRQTRECVAVLARKAAGESR